MVMREDGSVTYLGKREAGIKAWFGDGLEAITSFDIA
jgi:hypothetical protein